MEWKVVDRPDSFRLAPRRYRSIMTVSARRSLKTIARMSLDSSTELEVDRIVRGKARRRFQWDGLTRYLVWSP